MLDVVKLDGNILIYIFFISCSSLVPVYVIIVISMNVCRHLLALEEAGLV